MIILFGISDIGETISSWFQSFIENTYYRALYWIEIFLLKFVALVEDTMMVFTGEKTIVYNGRSNYLINIFFENTSIRNIYAAIGLIGIAFAFAFAVWSVIRKVLDLRGKQQGVTLGSIIGNLLKSIVLIAAMNAIVMAALYTTNILTKQISIAIQYGHMLSYEGGRKTFTNEQYAAMGRIINTIGNYSLNPSHRSRYNLNACYNEIRPDIQFLARQGVFDVIYPEDKPSWQSIIEKIAMAYDYNTETPLDTYDDGLTNAMLDAIDKLKKNPGIKALPYYDIEPVELDNIPMDRILFLVGTVGTVGKNAAVRNQAYNINPSFTDNARLPFYKGDKDIYDYDQVRETFNPSPAYTNYFLVWILSLFMLREMILLIVTCAARLFQLVSLYVVSPLAISSMPLDDGAKFKQWSTAFVIQLLSVIGMVVSLRLFLMYLPIIWSPQLTLSKNILLDCIMKGILTYGGMEAINRINNVFTGILADNAGWQAITASSMRDTFNQSALGKGLNALSGSSLSKGVGGFLWRNTGGAALGAAKGAMDNRSNEKSKARAAVDKQNFDRENQRAAKSLKDDLNYAKQHGTHLNGDKLGKGELNRMEKTLAYMEGGTGIDGKPGTMSRSEAEGLADADIRQDNLDSKAAAANERMRMERTNESRKNPPPMRNDHAQFNAANNVANNVQNNVAGAAANIPDNLRDIIPDNAPLIGGNNVADNAQYGAGNGGGGIIHDAGRGGAGVGAPNIGGNAGVGAAPNNGGNAGVGAAPNNGGNAGVGAAPNNVRNVGTGVGAQNIVNNNIAGGAQDNLRNIIPDNAPVNGPNNVNINIPNNISGNIPNNAQSNIPNNAQSNIPNNVQSNIPNNAPNISNNANGGARNNANVRNNANGNARNNAPRNGELPRKENDQI